ncbi:MAG: hypothetical protein GX323_06470 [Clostridiales bacterium]|nr:hypothetical protein [Clostridiales bacterium]
MINFKNILIDHFNKYPKMEIQDIVKLIYQSEFAGGHLIANKDESLKFLEEELISISNNPVYKSQPVFENIGGDIYRLNLVPAVRAGLSLSTINNLFVQTANSNKGTVSNFEKKLGLLIDLCKEGVLPFNRLEVDNYINSYKSQGYRAVSHTGTYRSNYYPAYRIISKEYIKYMDVFASIDRLVSLRRQVLVAIDGMCASGKTSLASTLGDIYDCNIFHMDDYFLQPHLKTRERLEEAGGNIDYVRFDNEIISGLKSRDSFSYQEYDCQTMSLSDKILVSPKLLNIIEGSYSMHPSLVGNYDLKIFLKHSPKQQRERILKRNGKAMYNKFIDLWIPLENLYFDTFRIEEESDIVIDTTQKKV